MSDEKDDETTELVAADPPPPADGKKRPKGWENILPHRIKPGEKRNPHGRNGAPWRNNGRWRAMMNNVGLEKVVDPIGADGRCKEQVTEHVEECRCKNKNLIPLFKLMVKSVYMAAIKGNVAAAQYVIDQQAGRAQQSVQIENTGGGGTPLVIMGLPDDGSSAELDKEDPAEASETPPAGDDDDE